MSRILTIISLLISSFVAAYAADAPLYVPDMNRIAVGRLQNAAQYDTLLSRYLQGDSTLNLEEMATIYYGHAFGPDYDPTDSFDDVEKAYADRDYKTVWRRAQDAMRLNPVSLDLIIKALVAASNIDDDNARRMIPILRTRYQLISNIILSSGKGSSPESPFVVICEDDLDRIVRNVICVESVMGRANIRNLDAVKVKLITSDRQHILYFDNTLHHKYQRERR